MSPFTMDGTKYILGDSKGGGEGGSEEGGGEAGGGMREGGRGVNDKSLQKPKHQNQL